MSDKTPPRDDGKPSKRTTYALTEKGKKALKNIKAQETKNHKHQVLEIPQEYPSLRDKFAGDALIGLIGRVWEENGKVPDDVMDKWAKAAYGTADAMIRARGQ